MDWIADVWQWVSTWNGAVTALATVITAAFAAFALIRATHDSRDRSRPYVIAEFRHAEHSDTALDLQIRNAGASMARDVTVTFDPPLSVPEGFGPNVTVHTMRRYQAPLPCLAPSQTLRNVWWSGRTGAGNKLVNAEPTPNQVTITVTYRGDRRRWRPYVDQFPLDTQVMLDETYSTSSTSIKGRLKTIDMSLGAASTALATIAKVAKSAEQRTSQGEDLNEAETIAARHARVMELVTRSSAQRPEVEPEGGQSREVEPEAGQPREVEPEAGQPREVEPEAGQPRELEPEASKPSEVEPEAGKPSEPEGGESARPSRT